MQRASTIFLTRKNTHFSCAPHEIRTSVLWIWSPTLYQLSQPVTPPHSTLPSLLLWCRRWLYTVGQTPHIYFDEETAREDRRSNGQVSTYDVDGFVHKDGSVVVPAVWQAGHGGPAVVAGEELFHQAWLQLHLGLKGVHAANGQDGVRAGRAAINVSRLWTLWRK